MNNKKKVVVITGAGSGIGEATALRFGKMGYSLHLTDIKADTLVALSEKLQALPCTFQTYQIDSSKREEIEKLAMKVGDQESSVDILCNNAGIGHSMAFADISQEDWEKVMSINFWGVLYGIQSFLPLMKKGEGKKHIINTASMSGFLAQPGMAAYNASKFAVMGLTETLAIELAHTNIYVSAICPGIVRTNIIQNSEKTSYGKVTEEKAAQLYQKLGSSPDKVARQIVRLSRSGRTFKVTSALPLMPVYYIKRISLRLYIAIMRLAHRFVA